MNFSNRDEKEEKSDKNLIRQLRSDSITRNIYSHIKLQTLNAKNITPQMKLSQNGNGQAKITRQQAYLSRLKIQEELKRKLQKNSLLSDIHNMKKKKYTNIIPQCLYPLRIQNQVLIINISMILLFSSLFTIFFGFHHNAVRESIIQKSNKAVYIQNQNFQARALTKYMDITNIIFYKTNSLLITTNQLYNYANNRQYQSNSAQQCQQYNQSNDFDSFCFIQQNDSDQSNFSNSNFISFISILNEFSLCFQFVKDLNTSIQISFTDRIVSIFPQQGISQNYSTKYMNQQNLSNANISDTNYLSRNVYQDSFSSKTLSNHVIQSIKLTNGSESQGIIMIPIEFMYFKNYFKTYNDLLVGLVSTNGQLQFSISEYEIKSYEKLIYIYDQEETGFNYQDWVNLTQMSKSNNTTYIMENLYFIDQLEVSIKQFMNLPYYFILFSDLLYLEQIKELYQTVITQMLVQQRTILANSIVLVILIVLILYLVIINLLKPIKQIRTIIYGNQKEIQMIYQESLWQPSDNILNILAMIIILKYSELQTLSFKKSKQCQIIEQFRFPLKQYQSRQIYQNVFLQNKVKIQQISYHAESLHELYFQLISTQFLEQKDYSQYSTRCDLEMI